MQLLIIDFDFSLSFVGRFKSSQRMLFSLTRIFQTSLIWFFLLRLTLCATSKAPVSGLYGLSENGSLIRSLDGANWTTLGSPLPYSQAQQLSCIDASRAIFYMIGYDMSSKDPVLVGVSLEDGQVITHVPLPFNDQTYIGIGQYLTPHTPSGSLFVGGQDSFKNHVIGLVDPQSGKFELLANLSSSFRDVFGGTSVFIPETNELWFELDLDIMILNLTSRIVTIIPVNESFSILGMNYDNAEKKIIGLAGGPGQGVRTIVSLDPIARKIIITGSVPAFANQMGGMTAYNDKQKTIFWIAQKTNAPTNSPWFLVQNQVKGGKVVTSESICSSSSGGLCPWSIHYYNN